MTKPIKTGYGYSIEGGVVFASREAVEAYIKRFIMDLADAPRSAKVTEINDDFAVTYVVDPADCTVCYENDIENDSDYCTEHAVDDYELTVEVVELWDAIAS